MEYQATKNKHRSLSRPGMMALEVRSSRPMPTDIPQRDTTPTTPTSSSGTTPTNLPNRPSGITRRRNRRCTAQGRTTPKTSKSFNKSPKRSEKVSRSSGSKKGKKRVSCAIPKEGFYPHVMRYKCNVCKFGTYFFDRIADHYADSKHSDFELYKTHLENWW